MASLRILVVTENYYCGGLDSFIINLVNHWPDVNARITLFCNACHPGIPTIRQHVRRQLEIIPHSNPLPTPFNYKQNLRAFRVMLYPIELLKRQLLFVRYLFIYYHLFKTVDADRLLVVNGGYPAGLTCRAASVAWGILGKRPLSIHNFHNFCQPIRWFELPFENLIDYFVHRFSAKMLSVSSACAQSIYTRRAFSSSNRVAFIYNGIEFRPSSTPPEHVRSSLGINTNEHLCLMLATYESRKGHQFLLESYSDVVRQIPGTRLLICGYGYPEDFDRVSRLVKAFELESHVILQGYREDVPDLLAASDVLLVPSQISESFGLTIVEAMSHGVPVVATRVGGIPEVLIDSQGGFLVDPSDTRGFADRIIRLLRNDTLRLTQGDQGKSRFNSYFRAEHMAALYASLVSDCVHIS